MSKTTRAVSRIFIAGDINDVWRELTKTGETQKAMFNMVMHTSGLRPGAMIQMRTSSNRYVGVVGEVLEIEPPHRYSHTFKFTNYDDPVCKVTYDLKQVDGGVEFTLTLEDVPVGTQTQKQMVPGGDMICAVLKQVVENGRPAFGYRMLHVLFRVAEPFTTKSAAVENWPLDRRIS